MIRAGEGSSKELRAQACAMLANAMLRGGHEKILLSQQCMVSVAGAFCMDGDAATIHDACSASRGAAKGRFKCTST